MFPKFSAKLRIRGKKYIQYPDNATTTSTVTVTKQKKSSTGNYKKKILQQGFSYVALNADISSRNKFKKLFDKITNTKLLVKSGGKKGLWINPDGIPKKIKNALNL